MAVPADPRPGTVPLLSRLRHLRDHTAVGLIDRNTSVAHHQKPLLIIHLKEGNIVSTMINGSQMLSIRENGDILGIVSADGQTADQCQKSRIFIPGIYADRIISRIAAV